MSGRAQELKCIPAVNQLLQSPALVSLAGSLAREVIVALVREVLDETRRQFLAGDIGREALADTALANRVTARAAAFQPLPLRRVINATGILLHTNLGRAPLSAGAQHAVATIQGGYGALELDLETGKRTSRLERVRRLLVQVCGSEAALAVNNNAAAVFLALHGLASGREVIISRGEQVEIGGSFRLPDIIAASGARMREVGTTNRTRLDDYRRAITPQSALILKVHPSNYVVAGFTESTGTRELAQLAHAEGILLMEDLGSGALRQHPPEFMHAEPRVQETLAAGVDLLSFSGDKLLGGPQAGVLLGREPVVARLGRHPLARVLRLDKLHLAALEATLVEYTRGAAGLSAIPLYRMLRRPVEDLGEQARDLAGHLRAAIGSPWRFEAVATEAALGGGSLPGRSVPSWGVAISPEGRSVDALAKWLRQADPAIVPRIYRESLVVDMRSLLEEDQALLPRLLTERLQSFTQQDDRTDA